MATQTEILNNLFETIDKGLSSFSKGIPAQQKRIFEDVETLLKELETNSSGNIKQSVKNLRLIGELKTKLDRIIGSKEWKQQVKEFVSTFNSVSQIQNQYFNTIESEFKPKSLYNELKTQAIDTTIAQLTESGMTANLTEKIQDILRQNISTGSKYTDLTKQVREFLTTTDKGLGALERYTSQITTDALNGYSRQYNSLVTADLGLDEWYQYTGTLIETSRPFCEAMKKKKYIHKSEFSKVVKGDFKEFKEFDGTLNPKTGLPAGMPAIETAENLVVLCGGYNCNHQMPVISPTAVPLNILLSIPKSKLSERSLKAIEEKLGNG